MIRLREAGAVSSVPNEPIVGFATVQSPVSLGKPPTATPAVLKAARSNDAVPPSISSVGPPSMSAMEGPLRNWRSLTIVG